MSLIVVVENKQINNKCVPCKYTNPHIPIFQDPLLILFQTSSCPNPIEFASQERLGINIHRPATPLLPPPSYVIAFQATLLSP